MQAWNATEEQLDELRREWRAMRRSHLHRRPDEAVILIISRRAATRHGSIHEPAARREIYEMKCYAHAVGLLQMCPPLEMFE